MDTSQTLHEKISIFETKHSNSFLTYRKLENPNRNSERVYQDSKKLLEELEKSLPAIFFNSQKTKDVSWVDELFVSVCRFNFLSYLGVFIARGVDIDRQKGSESGIYAATVEGHVEMVEALIKLQADVNCQSGAMNETPLFQACLQKSKILVEILLWANADPFKKTTEGKDCFTAAKDDIQITEMLNEAACFLV